MTSMVDTTQLALVAASASQAGPDNENYGAIGLQVGVNITALTGTAPTMTVIVEGKDKSGAYYTLLSSAALNAVAFTLLTLYPGVTPAANLAVSQVLPRNWRVRVVIAGTTPAVTATISASYCGPTDNAVS
jgi:hypothetical protein